MYVSRASFCAELAVLRMSHQIKQVSPGRAVKVSDDSGLDTGQDFLCKLQIKFTYTRHQNVWHGWPVY